MHLVSSLFLSSYCMSTGLLSDRKAIRVRLLKAKATAHDALPFEMRPDGKSVEV